MCDRRKRPSLAPKLGILVGTIALTILLAGLAAPGWAGPNGLPFNTSSFQEHPGPWFHPHPQGPPGPWNTGPARAPEIDPGLVGSTVTLVLGGLLLLNDRRGRR